MSIKNSSMFTVLMIPSFYGLAAWALALFVLFLDPLPTNAISGIGITVFIFVFICFVSATLISLKFFKRIKFVGRSNNTSNLFWLVIFLHCIGLIGISLYILELARVLGGFSAVMYSLNENTLVVRAAADEAVSVGTQLSYLGWLGIYISILIVSGNHIPQGTRRNVIILFSILQFVGNLVYVDRTRPMWIIFVSILLVVITSISTGKNPIKYLLALFVIVVSYFIGFAIFTEKFDATEGVFNNLYIYLIGGFAYFDALINMAGNFDYVPSRILYPLFKLAAFISQDIAPPSQVLDFIYVPYPTNVGTFLEPLYSDGGYVYLFFGLPLVIFLVNYLAYKGLQSESRFLGLILWANMCFVFAICFFVPKYVSFPSWIFVFIFYAGRWYEKWKQRHYL